MIKEAFFHVLKKRFCNDCLYLFSDKTFDEKNLLLSIIGDDIIGLRSTANIRIRFFLINTYYLLFYYCLKNVKYVIIIDIKYNRNLFKKSRTIKQHIFKL